MSKTALRAYLKTGMQVEHPDGTVFTIVKDGRYILSEGTKISQMILTPAGQKPNIPVDFVMIRKDNT